MNALRASATPRGAAPHAEFGGFCELKNRAMVVAGSLRPFVCADVYFVPPVAVLEDAADVLSYHLLGCYTGGVGVEQTKSAAIQIIGIPTRGRRDRVWIIRGIDAEIRRAADV